MNNTQIDHERTLFEVAATKLGIWPETGRAFSIWLAARQPLMAGYDIGRWQDSSGHGSNAMATECSAWRNFFASLDVASPSKSNIEELACVLVQETGGDYETIRGHIARIMGDSE